MRRPAPDQSSIWILNLLSGVLLFSFMIVNALEKIAGLFGGLDSCATLH